MGANAISRDRLVLLTDAEVVPYHASRMTNLIAIAAVPTAHYRWRGYAHAARWRD